MRSNISSKKISSQKSNYFNYLWHLIIGLIMVFLAYHIFNFFRHQVELAEVKQVFILTCFTLIRVVALIILSTIIWVPIGIFIGNSQTLTSIMQPLAQFLSAFSANLLFPVAVIAIQHFHLSPNIWLTFLMMMGTQWLILFYIISGVTAFPNDLREITQSLNVKGPLWWRKVMLPAIAPYYVTGAITASGAAWNASIVAEMVRWGDTILIADGVGRYIAEMTIKGDYPHILLGVAMMCLFVLVVNRLFWQPIYNFVNQKWRY